MRNSGAIDSTFFGFRRGVKLRRMLADTRKVFTYILINTSWRRIIYKLFEGKLIETGSIAP